MTSLKQKRSRIKPLLARLHKEFNVSSAEIEALDAWNKSIIACALVSNDGAFCQRALQEVLGFVEHNWPDLLILEHHIELV